MAQTKVLSMHSVMHPFPHSIGSNQSAAKALAMMTEHNCRHLPVQDAGKLVGILTDRDINFALRVDGCEPENLAVRDCYTGDPFVVAPETAVYLVASKMAHEHIGCALVADQGKLVGIFTTVDACHLLAELLSGRAEQ